MSALSTAQDRTFQDTLKILIHERSALRRKVSKSSHRLRDSYSRRHPGLIVDPKKNPYRESKFFNHSHFVFLRQMLKSGTGVKLCAFFLGFVTVKLLLDLSPRGKTS